jgi:DNA-binding GntR family transcriptional regulator
VLEKIAAGSVSQAVADKAQEMDWAFHEAIIGSMRNAIVSDIYRVNSVKIRLTDQDGLRLTAHNLKRVMTEHLAIIDAIKRRDKDAAVTGRNADAAHAVDSLLRVEACAHGHNVMFWTPNSSAR